MINFTIYFDGSLEDFVNFAEQVRLATMDDEGRSIVSWPSDRLKTNPFQRTLLFHPKRTPDVAGKIHVIGGFDPLVGKTDKTLLSITIEEETYDSVWQIWESFKDELDKKDLMIGEPLGSFSVPKRSDIKQHHQEARSKSGRPRDPDYEWARRQVHEEGRSNPEVFVEWQQRIDPQKLEALANPLESFKKAMKKKPE